MDRLSSLLKGRCYALLLGLYFFSFWIVPQGWDETKPLDGSWKYAFGKFRELGFSFGNDSWFTYGPLAHWFGETTDSLLFYPLPYYLLGLLVAVVIGVSFARLLESLRIPFPAGIVAVLLFPLSCIGMDDVAEVHMVVALFLLLITLSLREKAEPVAMAVMISLSACSLLYKFSLGLLSLLLVVLLFGSLVVRRKLTLLTMSLYGMGYLGLVYFLFMVTSGSYDFFTYLLLGLELSGKYSEIMIGSLPYSPSYYIPGILYVLLGAVLAWQASRKVPGGGAAACLMAAYLGAGLFLFKHGFVRADHSHIRLFYASLTPVLAMLAMIAFTGPKTRSASAVAVPCTVVLALVLLFGSAMNSLPGENSVVNLAANWLKIGQRVAAAAPGQGPERSRRRREAILAGHPLLFPVLNDSARRFADHGRKPRITFYPWELMLFEGVQGFELAPSPSLQLYAAGPHSRTHRKEREFLISAKRPDVVVVGPMSIDDRSQVAELTDLLPALYAGYRLLAVAEGFAVLEAQEAGTFPEAVVRYADLPQGMRGEFFQVRLDAYPVNRYLWLLGTTLFKSPELTVVVTVGYGDGRNVAYAWRGYLSQLQEGVFFFPGTLPDFFLRCFAPPNEGDRREFIPVRSVAAEVQRGGGFWNLPVFPPVVPLTVRSCTFGAATGS